MREHDFEIGQWVTCEGEYMQITEFIGLRVLGCRFAGKTRIVVKQYSKLTPASLTPDFSKAKAGDECFLTWLGITRIEFRNKNDVYIEDLERTFYFNGNYCLEDTHPSLFNSFAQFQAYWAEKALSLKKGDNK